MDIINNLDNPHNESNLITNLINIIFEKYKIKLSPDDPIFMTILLNKEVLKDFLIEINTELQKLPNALETVYIDSIKVLDRDFNNKISLINEAHKEGLDNFKNSIINIFSEDVNVKNSYLNLIEETKKSFKQDIDNYTSLYKSDLEELKDISLEIKKNNNNVPKNRVKFFFCGTLFFLLLSIIFNVFIYIHSSNISTNYSKLVKIIYSANSIYKNNDAIKYIIDKYDLE